MSDSSRNGLVRRALLSAAVLSALLALTITAGLVLSSRVLVLVGVLLQCCVAAGFLIDHRELGRSLRLSLAVVALFALALLVLPVVTTETGFLAPGQFAPGERNDDPP